MRASEHAPRDPSRVLERRHGLAEIVKRGGGVLAEHRRVNRPHFERKSISFSENASRHAHRFAQQCLRIAQGNLALTYDRSGRHESALKINRDVYSGYLKLHGEEHDSTFLAANNYAWNLKGLKRFEEAKGLLRKTMPVARRVLGENDLVTLRMKWCYAVALYRADGATLDDLREAVTTLEETERIARRLLGGSHPITVEIEYCLQESRFILTGGAALRRTSPAQQIGEPKPTGIKVGAAALFAFAVVYYFCYAWGASTAPAPRAPEL